MSATGPRITTGRLKLAEGAETATVEVPFAAKTPDPALPTAAQPKTTSPSIPCRQRPRDSVLANGARAQRPCFTSWSLAPPPQVGVGSHPAPQLHRKTKTGRGRSGLHLVCVCSCPGGEVGSRLEQLSLADSVVCKLQQPREGGGGRHPAPACFINKVLLAHSPRHPFHAASLLGYTLTPLLFSAPGLQAPLPRAPYLDF